MPVTDVTGTDACVFPNAVKDLDSARENFCLAGIKERSYYKNEFVGKNKNRNKITIIKDGDRACPIRCQMKILTDAKVFLLLTMIWLAI